MNCSVFDSDVDTLSHWRRVTSNFNLRFQGHSTPSGLQPALDGDPQIIVLDHSVVIHDLVDLLRNCCDHYRQHIFVVSSNKLTIPQVVHLVHSGVAWVFTKPLESSAIEQAMPRIIELAKSVAQQVEEFRMLYDLSNRLTQRERDVMDLVLEGAANKELADQLKISVRTVEARRSKVYQKLESTNMVALVRRVDRLELLRSRFVTKRPEGHAVNLHSHLDLRSQHQASDSRPHNGTIS